MPTFFLYQRSLINIKFNKKCRNLEVSYYYHNTCLMIMILILNLQYHHELQSTWWQDENVPHRNSTSVAGIIDQNNCLQLCTYKEIPALSCPHMIVLTLCYTQGRAALVWSWHLSEMHCKTTKFCGDFILQRDCVREIKYLQDWQFLRVTVKLPVLKN